MLFNKLFNIFAQFGLCSSDISVTVTITEMEIFLLSLTETKSKTMLIFKTKIIFKKCFTKLIKTKTFLKKMKR